MDYVVCLRLCGIGTDDVMTPPPTRRLATRLSQYADRYVTATPSSNSRTNPFGARFQFIADILHIGVAPVQGRTPGPKPISPNPIPVKTAIHLSKAHSMRLDQIGKPRKILQPTFYGDLVFPDLKNAPYTFIPPMLRPDKR